MHSCSSKFWSSASIYSEHLFLILAGWKVPFDGSFVSQKYWTEVILGFDIGMYKYVSAVSDGIEHD